MSFGICFGIVCKDIMSGCVIGQSDVKYVGRVIEERGRERGRVRER